MYVPVLYSSSCSDFKWPAILASEHVQLQYSTNRSENRILYEGLWKTYSGSVWIQDVPDDIQLRLSFIAHTGFAGNRGVESTHYSIEPSFHWSTIQADVRMFVKACMLCLSSTGGGACSVRSALPSIESPLKTCSSLTILNWIDTRWVKVCSKAQIRSFGLLLVLLIPGNVRRKLCYSHH